MTDRHANKITHEPFFGKLANAQFMHDLFSKQVSPVIVHSNQTTYQTIAKAHNSNTTWAKQSYHDLGKI